MKTHCFRLIPGDDLKISIEQFVKSNRIMAGAVITCVGSLQRAGLRMANQRSSETRTDKFEILSLTGTVSMNGCHLHISISDKNGNVTGGHLQPGCVVYTTAELILAEIDGVEFSREPDDKTGFRELVIKHER